MNGGVGWTTDYISEGDEEDEGNDEEEDDGEEEEEEEEQRQADDGGWYTRDEFITYYGEFSWEEEWDGAGGETEEETGEETGGETGEEDGTGGEEKSAVMGMKERGGGGKEGEEGDGGDSTIADSTTDLTVHMENVLMTSSEVSRRLHGVSINVTGTGLSDAVVTTLCNGSGEGRRCVRRRERMMRASVEREAEVMGMQV